jgi:hypothetical protein
VGSEEGEPELQMVGDIWRKRLVYLAGWSEGREGGVE